jgi:hypothetical protein
MTSRRTWSKNGGPRLPRVGSRRSRSPIPLAGLPASQETNTSILITDSKLHSTSAHPRRQLLCDETATGLSACSLTETYASLASFCLVVACTGHSKQRSHQEHTRNSACYDRMWVDSTLVVLCCTSAVPVKPDLITTAQQHCCG